MAYRKKKFFQYPYRWLVARSVLAFALFALFSASRMFAEEAVVTLDPAKSQVEFTLESTFHTVHGSFKLKSGTINYDTATGAASGAIVVDATSGNSGNRARDNKMHKDVLESARYPEIVFNPQKVSGAATQGASRVESPGNLSGPWSRTRVDVVDSAHDRRKQRFGQHKLCSALPGLGDEKPERVVPAGQRQGEHLRPNGGFNCPPGVRAIGAADNSLRG